MKKSKITPREVVMLVFLAVLLIGVIYYMGFYTPLQEELASIAKDVSEMETKIDSYKSDIKKMNDMQAELDEILSRPKDEITEIAPYDNKEAVMYQLYAILGQSEEYTLTFQDPEIGEDGTVRRIVTMEFRCSDYESAKEIIRNLTDSPWRCLVGNITLAGENENLQTNQVDATATITYFEHTGLK